MAWRKRGRPRTIGAKRRRTTAAGRRPEIDLGSSELRLRKIHVANGSTAPVELVDVVGVLFANELARLRYGVQLVIQRQRRGRPARSSAARRTSKR